jgi:predicted phosphoribosyltransferase
MKWCASKRPEQVYAVAQFYRNFPQVEDEEVIAVLAQRAKKARNRHAMSATQPE